MNKRYITIGEHNNEILGCPTTLGKYEKLYGGKTTSIERKRHEDIWGILTWESKNLIMYLLSMIVHDVIESDDFILVQNNEDGTIKAIIKNNLKFNNVNVEVDVSDLIKTIFGDRHINPHKLI